MPGYRPTPTREEAEAGTEANFTLLYFTLLFVTGICYLILHFRITINSCLLTNNT